MIVDIKEIILQIAFLHKEVCKVSLIEKRLPHLYELIDEHQCSWPYSKVFCNGTSFARVVIISLNKESAWILSGPSHKVKCSCTTT